MRGKSDAAQLLRGFFNDGLGFGVTMWSIRPAASSI
jgi:hypothetical protein